MAGTKDKRVFFSLQYTFILASYFIENDNSVYLVYLNEVTIILISYEKGHNSMEPVQSSHNHNALSKQPFLYDVF